MVVVVLIDVACLYGEHEALVVVGGKTALVVVVVVVSNACSRGVVVIVAREIVQLVVAYVQSAGNLCDIRQMAQVDMGRMQGLA